MSDEANLSEDDAFISTLKMLVPPEGQPGSEYLLLYTSFGLVKGRVGMVVAQNLHSADPSGRSEVIELSNVAVEHYSNHLPTAAFERFYLRLSEIQGLAVISMVS
ncbi:MAG TPA: hypothetical protein VJQ56_02335 [Blastocatellia bacterium]|nr:hypothetical protein [Blastocatellia bacterium]